MSTTGHPTEPSYWLRLMIVLFISLPILGCHTLLVLLHPPQPTDNDGMVSFSAEIVPIFTTHCAGCHSPGGMADLAGIELELTADVAHQHLVNQPSVQRPELTLVAPGEADASLVFSKVTQDAPPVGKRMPLFAPILTEEEMDLIRNWINQGAADN